MFIIIDNDTTFAPVTYPIDTPEQERRARIAIAAAGLEYAHVWTASPGHKLSYCTQARIAAYDPDDEVTAVYTPSPDLLRAATR